MGARSILIGILMKGRNVRNNMLTVARVDDDSACIAICIAYLFDLRIFLLRLNTQVTKIALQRLDELLGLFRPRRATPHEWHLLLFSRFIGSYDDLQVYSLRCECDRSSLYKVFIFRTFRMSGQDNFAFPALESGLSIVWAPIRGLITADSRDFTFSCSAIKYFSIFVF